MNVTRTGTDLVKLIFQIHEVDYPEEKPIRTQSSQARMLGLLQCEGYADARRCVNRTLSANIFSFLQQRTHRIFQSLFHRHQ